MISARLLSLRRPVKHGRHRLYSVRLQVSEILRLFVYVIRSRIVRQKLSHRVDPDTVKERCCLFSNALQGCNWGSCIHRLLHRYYIIVNGLSAKMNLDVAVRVQIA